MRTLFAILRSTIAALLACTVCIVPSCASMGGGGMKGMLSEPAAMARDVSG
ncbi:MAG TPA: hypothetical protein VFF44_12215 [Casimicrobiaceae bacterium]|nr:hypothetical protein [Casimicrobiaceae bacterium]